MASAEVSLQSKTKPRVLLIHGDAPGDDLVVQEIPYSSAALAGATGRSSTLDDWLLENKKCPCEPRRMAEEELARKIQELARSNRELEQFAFVASHDLQEPLRMVAAYTQLLAEKYRGKLDSEADKYIAYASDGALRLQTLIQNLLAFSRVGRGDTVCGEVDSNLAVEEALHNLSHAIVESGAVIDVGVLPVVSAERSQLTQVFQNLIGNAIKFRREEPPVISVQSARAGRNWLFSVSDNGIGIAPDYAETVFVIFQRLHSRTEYPGNGLGLAICKRIIERFGGRIWFESHLGLGSTFKFTLLAVGPDEKGGARL